MTEENKNLVYYLTITDQELALLQKVFFSSIKGVELALQRRVPMGKAAAEQYKKDLESFYEKINQCEALKDEVKNDEQKKAE